MIGRWVRGAAIVLAACALNAGASAQPAQPPLAAPIEHSEHLSRFFGGLAALDPNAANPVNPAHTRVRVTQLGDSHIAADMFSGHLRVLFQSRFGDGGRGFVLPGKPWRSYWQANVSADQVGDWRVDLKGDGRDDGAQGPGNCAAASNDPRARVTAASATKGDVGRHFSSVDVLFVRQGDGGCFEVRDGDVLLGRVGTRGPWPEPDGRRFQLADGPHQISVSPLDAAPQTETRLLGFSLENPTGVIWDALGINGALARGLLRSTPEALSGVLQRLAPTLLVVSFGTNEAFDSNLSPDLYARQLAAVLRALRTAAPDADCLLTGPGDALKGRRPPETFEPLYAAQRTQAEAAGCAFFDARTAMGGPGSIRAWRRAGMAQGDFVHLTREGYERLGDLLAAALLEGYETFRAPPAPPPIPASEP